MIVETLFDLIYGLLEIIFSPVSLPSLPNEVQSILDGIVDLMVNSIGLFSVFFDMNVVRVLLPIVIVIVNFEKIWNLIMFILRKIPFLGIE